MKVNGWLLYNKEDAKRNETFISWFLEEAQKLAFEMSLVLKEELLYGIRNHRLYLEHQKFSLPDFVVMRHIDPLLTKQFELLGVRVFNTSFVADCCNDKAKTHQYLASSGIRMMDTIFLKTHELQVDSIPFDYPFVLKAVEGRGGQHVYLLTSKSELQALVSQLTSHSIIIQKLGPVPGKDVRVFVIGNDIIGATLRTSSSSFKANVSLGGTSSLYQLCSSEKELVNKIVSRFNGELGFVGIDFLFDEDGKFVFNEIEDVVGSRTLSANSTINVVKLYLQHIRTCITKAASRE